MKEILFLLILLLGMSCAQKKPEAHPSGLDIAEINHNKWTRITKQNLLHLTQVYDLTPFFFTRKIQIESRVIPHSHPILTLNTRHAQNPHKLLSVFLHEELHWWFEKNPEATEKAKADLKKAFPKAPQTGTRGSDSTYLHLLVCYLEMRALGHYIGVKEAKELVSEIMSKDKIYPWIYKEILKNPKIFHEVVNKHNLYPPLT